LFQRDYISMECFMRRFVRGAVAASTALCALSACNGPETVIATPVTQYAGVRFINAVPDTAGALGLDMRFVDIVESNAQFRLAFRNAPATTSGVTTSAATQYKAATAGQRHFRIFLDDTLQAIAQIKLADTTVALTPGTNYTGILWGNARGGAPAMRLTFFPENAPDPGAQVALRVINATGSPIDVRQYVATGTAPTAATWANVPPLSVSSYVLVAPSQIRYNVQPAGGGTALFTDMLAIIGAPASSSLGAGGKLDIEPLPGTTVAGSAVSLIVYPRSVAGTRTPQTAPFQVPAGAFVWDRRPPRGF
jgi:hypothetical protein